MTNRPEHWLYGYPETFVGVASYLERITGRTTAINADMCVRPPWGCGASAAKFRDTQSIKEYTISGLCQQCQDGVFGKQNGELT